MQSKKRKKGGVENFVKDVESFRKLLDDRDEVIKQKFNDGGAFKILIDIISGIAVGCFLGYSLDNYFGTLPFMLFICIVFGAAGGIYNAYKGALVDMKKRGEE